MSNPPKEMRQYCPLKININKSCGAGFSVFFSGLLSWFNRCWVGLTVGLLTFINYIICIYIPHKTQVNQGILNPT